MKQRNNIIDRRALLLNAGKALAAAPFVTLVACSGDNSDPQNPATQPVVEDNSPGDESPAQNTSEWLSGGTSAMQVSFPPEISPFASGLGNMCTLTEEFTLGPCFFEVAEERDDISEGQPGVPMTLGMKLVDANCSAIEGAIIEVWWCNAEGFYSGDTAQASGSVNGFSASFCTGNNSAALASTSFRGIKTTNGDGEVYFKACFPGWYPRRTTHIHFRIVLNGAAQLISQFAFEDTLANAIYLNNQDYTGVEKDTANDSDNIFSSGDVNDYIYEVERQPDNSMLAYKAIQINI